MNLNGKWNLYYYPAYEQSIKTVEQLKNANLPMVKATVPGNVELDLSKAGILPSDLYMGENIREAEKFETYDWWYETDRWGNDLLCCNGTLDEISGKCKVYDIDSGEVLFEKEFTAAPNSNTYLDKIRLMYSEQRMLIIEWNVDGETSFNTYLYGAPKYDLQQYKSWLKKIAKL